MQAENRSMGESLEKRVKESIGHRVHVVRPFLREIECTIGKVFENEEMKVEEMSSEVTKDIEMNESFLQGNIKKRFETYNFIKENLLKLGT